MQNAQCKMQNAKSKNAEHRTPGAGKPSGIQHSAFGIVHSAASRQPPAARYSAISPSLKRAKRETVMFSPVWATAAATIWCTFTAASRIDGWSSRHTRS